MKRNDVGGSNEVLMAAVGLSLVVTRIIEFRSIRRNNVRLGRYIGYA